MSYRQYIRKVEKDQFLLDWTKSLLRALWISQLKEIRMLRKENRRLRKGILTA